jgi:hypothetical protein
MASPKKVRRKKSDAAEQRRLHEAAAKCIGVLKGDSSRQSENVREIVRDRLRQRYGR